MSEWKRVNLGECIKEINEKTIKNNQYEVLSVTKDGIFSQEEFFKKQIASENNIGYKIIRKNNLVFSTMNLWMGSLDVLTNYEIGIVSPAYKVFEFNENLMIPEYGNYFMKSYYMLEQYKNCSEQGASIVRRNLDLKVLLNIEISIPPIEEQEKIVKILRNTDFIIEKYRNILEEKEKFVKSQFIEIFGNPIINNKGWRTDIINNVAPAINYKGEFEDKVWLLNLDMIEPNTGRIISYLYEDKDKIKTSTCSFNEENVLYSKLRPYLNKVVIPKTKGYATSELIPLKPNSKYLTRYFFSQLLRTDEFVKFISEKVAGTKMPGVSMDLFRKFEVILPPIKLQNQFEEIVKKVDKQKLLLEQQKQNYQNLKKGLMQKLLTGKVRVKI